MASNEELKQVYNMFTDTWRFYKKYADVKDTDEYWKAAVDECIAVSKKYGEHKLIVSLVLAVIDEFERKVKELRNNADTAV